MGTVIDSETERPLKYAHIMMVGKMIGTLSGADGRFVLSAVPPGSYTIEARLFGYWRAVVDSLQVSRGDTTAVVLALDVQLGPTIDFTVESAQQDTSTSVHRWADISTTWREKPQVLRAPQPYEFEGVIAFRELKGDSLVCLLVSGERNHFRCGSMRSFPRAVVDTLLSLRDGDRVRVRGVDIEWSEIEKLD
jgi:hypothetical protein